MSIGEQRPMTLYSGFSCGVAKDGVRCVSKYKPERDL